MMMPRFLFLVICLHTAALFAEEGLPRVEVDYRVMGRGSPIVGKSVSQIIPPKSIKHIVLRQMSSRSIRIGETLTQEQKEEKANRIIDVLFNSTGSGTKWGRRAEEGRGATFVITNESGEVYFVHALRSDPFQDVTAFIVYGKGFCGRFTVETEDSES